MAERVPAGLLDLRMARLGLVQLNKRLPVNVRPLFGIKPTVNAYTVAHFVSAGARLLAAGQPEADDQVSRAFNRRLRWLERNQRPDGGWTYPFDVQTKTHFYPRTVSNVVCTSFAANALLDAAGFDHEFDYDTLVRASRFALDHLLVESDGGSYFGYHPGDRDVIHNANMLAAQFVVRTGLLTGHDEFVAPAMATVDRTLAAIRADGSMAYGEGAHLDWVDGHHTGFVIEALLELDRCHADSRLRPIIDRMADFYRRELFGPCGTPLARPGQQFPIDTISGAQGIQTFAKLGGDDLEQAATIARFMVGEMRGAAGHFVFQRGRRHVKSVPYARWSDAPMSLALAVLGQALGQS